MVPFHDDAYEEVKRHQAELRASLQQSRVVAYHSRTGLLTRYVRRLADQLDPSGRIRKDLR